MSNTALAIAPPLDGVKKGTFVYRTIKDRWPQILTRVIDQVHRLHFTHTSVYGQAGDQDIKAVIQELSQMKYEMQTDKPLRCIADSGENYAIWNDRLKQMQAEVSERFVYRCLQMGEENATWYKAPWLFVECYLYRRIAGSFAKTTTLTEFDPFKTQKQNTFVDSLDAIEILAKELPNVLKEPFEETKNIGRMMEICLWGNKCDLSLSGGKGVGNLGSPLEQVNELRDKILVNDIDKAIAVMSNSPTKRIDIILDNSGLEVFDDLLLAEVLLHKKKVNKVVFHGKSIPWFVSDVTNNDFFWVTEMLLQSRCSEVKEVGVRWKDRVETGEFEFCAHTFWTLPFDYSEMSKYARDLYDNLSKSSLLIFKGDLNYRKLVGDRDWPLDFSFKDALRGFHPAPLIALRTLKAETQVGLSRETISHLKEQFKGSKTWMVTGEFAVAQFCEQ